jgi:very-short-patch-repair endonuclease
MTPQNETPITSSSMEEVAAKRPEEVRALEVEKKPPVATLKRQRASPPQSALRADSSSIEEERGAKSWLRRRAQQMRAEMTPHEKAMWRLLHESELVALNWRRQTEFGNYILDFVSHSARLVIEVDGAQHGMTENAAHDAERTEWLKSEGYTVLRFWNQEAVRAPDDVWRSIYAAALQTKAAPRMKRWRAQHTNSIKQANAQIASSSMEEAPRSGGGGARAGVAGEPPVGVHRRRRASPPQSSLRDDSSSIEEEQN